MLLGVPGRPPGDFRYHPRIILGKAGLGIPRLTEGEDIHHQVRFLTSIVSSPGRQRRRVSAARERLLPMFVKIFTVAWRF
jgi:hypothetical protein